MRNPLQAMLLNSSSKNSGGKSSLSLMPLLLRMKSDMVIFFFTCA